ncbi:MAG: EscU/YscU/HrcU family type III secretion system export apparatus switch protein [Ectothiorhodospiraceae bacterium]|nr:EscU/YscU/HrcU family type III secretion system export apparatus switch protein [Ectothiorhodospiraceae bacterium]
MSDKHHTPTTAVALHYDGKEAPRITAKGSGELAEKIIALAKEHGIPLQEDAALINLLSKLDLGDEIPQPLYTAVAEVIAFAYILSGKMPEGFDPAAEPTE